MAETTIEDTELYSDDVGLGAEDKKYAQSNRLEWFKGEKGRKYRAALVYFHPLAASAAIALRKQNPNVSKEEIVTAIEKLVAKRAEDLKKSVGSLADHDKLDILNSRFKKVQAYFKEGVGYVLSPKDTTDPVWRSMGDMKTYFTTALLIYPTDKEGAVDKDKIATDWAVVPWRFSSKIYERMHAISESLRENDLSIANQDLLIKCTNKEFQNFDVDPAGKAIWRQHPKFAEAVLAKAHALYEKLVPFREMSTADLKLKLGMSTGGSTEESVSGDDFGGLLNQI